MKYLHVTERDGRYLSELREAAVPEPRADEVLVRVAASTRTPGKLAALAAAGADLALLGPRVAPAIEQRWGPDSVAVVLDPVGATTLPEDLAVLAPGGRIISIATLGGATASLDLSLLMRKRARLIGSTLRARSRIEKAELVAQFRRYILPAFVVGALPVTLDAVVRRAP